MTPDFTRLTRNWIQWAALGQLDNAAVSTTCADCTILFSSQGYSVHLRHDDDRWVVDTVDDRGRRTHAAATLSSYPLCETYLIWMWASMARTVLRAPILGLQLYASGFDAGVETRPISDGIIELRSPDGWAVLMEPYATIFSHLMGRSAEEIEQMVRAGLGI